MIMSDTFSEQTSSTLPIIISFTSNTKAKRIRKIRDFLRYHPNCQKYFTEGPNFVADGINEFRLYYVDSSLYADKKTLKRLNVEKKEIVFGSTSEDSLERFDLPVEDEESQYGMIGLPVPDLDLYEQSIKRSDKATTMYCYCQTSSYEAQSSNFTCDCAPHLEKVSKSFQIGPDLRFNIVYVNHENTFYPIYAKKTVDATIQTEEFVFTEHVTETFTRSNCLHDINPSQNDSSEAVYQISKDSSVKFQIRESPSFVYDENWIMEKPEKKKVTTFRTFCSKMEEKGLCKYNDESEINVACKTTSVRFSIKKSPSFVANYFLEIFRQKKANENAEETEICEKSIVNYIEREEVKKQLKIKKRYALPFKNEDETKPRVKNDTFKKAKDKHRKRSPKKEDLETAKHHHRAHRKTVLNTIDNKYPLVKYRDTNKIDKLNRYHKNVRNSTCCTVKCLFKCTNVDFFVKRSHYAILKKYHQQLNKHKRDRERRGHKHRHKKNEDHAKKHTQNQKKHYNHYKQRQVVQNVNIGFNIHQTPHSLSDSRTRTTISGFLHSYKPWHWQDSSKLSVCIDEECFTEETPYEEYFRAHSPPRKWKTPHMKNNK